MNEQRQPEWFFTTVCLHVQRSSKANSIELLPLCTGGMKKGGPPAPAPPRLLPGKRWLNLSCPPWPETPKTLTERLTTLSVVPRNAYLTDCSQTRGNATPVEATSSFGVMPRHTEVPSLNSLSLMQL